MIAKVLKRALPRISSLPLKASVALPSATRFGSGVIKYQFDEDDY